ncbi:hypothetical protein RHMOL_Rhmol02G0277100 [Rhododendron molle]|uniref:Uncharacterized protein n=3 Tax=Rhododendron molle TaxID=49168 RepID=A0ACC0PUZ0_RHOML|nr:hypothetical protein RHMOL_Rhmol02G0277100 [Rhododendron molle]KAI8569412.1 hypothetical protein RHMOL_Rhmol02G0277100 [Rhododendron molle]KAI8569413.1 hypothetical protein RHMOL_Rhmol02G0277100 [Rhododendron molle]
MGEFIAKEVSTAPHNGYSDSLFPAQLTGINMIMFYAPVLFKIIGFGSDASLMSADLRIVDVGAIIVSIYGVDTWGRRFLFLHGGTQINVPLQGKEANIKLRNIGEVNDVDEEFNDLMAASEAAKMVEHPWGNLLQRKYRPHLTMAILIP